ncbi:MAG: UDP-N-acetylmuramate--L-alanine ligase [Candidatus Nealsonbacteria bacterium CG10_big_fil_rev_8_21_14_0_10_36_24]|uniref:UDP-N-acetylmuramate--L-alanine ligase n=2 Tax=Candidatus Nealsoniibacteriota TaxID=1817911 RepID=A0A2H0YRF0_9BACT|nr:MAG: UDP-N-acetylmuramate--L-alanine ligase [Candidatus Nealsonbacteria bacterium CG10_big_fil_rev_8_21_14_0_10_36_24]PIS40313.1 MAG: UDP-N-acetylmuramate--L-alanine ligase [Candidatus Nealsonbacteria bacterium CG08_land_8_20_14_0_20_36_22]
MKIHFIGIGGIGTSALAQYYLAKGHDVSGSDLVSSEITDFLEKKGVKLLKQIPKDVELVIYSPAVSNPPAGAKSYPEFLGELTKKYFTIAVSGTHGKSTTTAMIALILIKAGFDPTVIIGTKLKEFGNSNFRMGESKYLVIEADEWQASFLNYWPKIIVLTNLEREHLDYYKNLNHVLRTFREYIKHLPENGVLVANDDDKNINKIFNFQFSIFNKFSIKQKEAKKLRKILKVPGEHNVYNALAALTAARALKIPDKISFRALSEYRGAWRRFEEKELRIKNLKLKIISDYAHHPTEIKATLKAAREKFPDKIIWCLFQPHQYQRTFYLFDDFVKVFSGASVDRLIITNIYDVAGREKKEIKKKISSKKLIKKINKPWAIFLPKEKIKNYFINNLKGGEVVMIMGAGDIYKLFYEL